MHTTHERAGVAVVGYGRGGADVLRRLLDCPVEVWDPYDLAMGRAEGREYRAVVVENFHPARPASALQACTARWALPGDPLTVVSVDDPAGRRLARRLGRRAFAYSEGKDCADLTAKNVNLRWGRLEFDALTRNDLARVRLPLGEEPDVYGPLSALSCALALGMPFGEAVRRLCLAE